MVSAANSAMMCVCFGGGAVARVPLAATPRKAKRPTNQKAMASTVQVAGMPLMSFVVVMCVVIVVSVCVCTYPMIKLNRWRIKVLARNQIDDEEAEDYDEDDEEGGGPNQVSMRGPPPPQQQRGGGGNNWNKRMSMFARGPAPILFQKNQGPPSYPPPYMGGGPPMGSPPPMGYPPQGPPPPQQGYGAPPQGYPPQGYPPGQQQQQQQQPRY